MIRQITKETKALCCISLAWFLVLAGRYSISNLLPRIVSELNVSWTDAGLALTMMWLIYASIQFPSGIYSDIKGRKITILIAMIIFSVSYLLVGLSIHYTMFFLALLLLGAGTGGYPAVGISMITDIFKEKRGKALGIQESAGSIAYIVPLFAAVIASFFDWRMFFFIWAAFSTISVVLFYFFTSESTILPEKVMIKERIIDGITILKQKDIQLMFIINLFIAITWISYMSFFPSYLIVQKGFTEIQAAIALGILGVGGFVFKPVVGSLSDRYDKKTIIIALSILSAVGTLFIVYINSLPLILLLSFFPAFATAVFPVVSSYLMGIWPEKGRAGKLGFYRSIIILLASPSSAIIGILADQYTFDIPFIGVAGLLFLVALILILNILITKKQKKKT
jgi:predicted MFS family arabinose efflux permease